MTILGPIIIEPGTFDMCNLGDLAMLQVAICRLRLAAPSAELRVFTDDPDALEASCPGALPVSEDARRHWYAESFFLGSVQSLLPRGASRRLSRAQHELRRHHPRLMGSAMRLRAHMNPAYWKSLRSFLSLMERASFLVVAGQHTIADSFYTRTRNLLETLEAALLRGTPTVMLGQGIGPLTNRELLAMARDILPAVGLIAVREPNIGPPALSALGVSESRIFLTGDEAVAPAFAASSRALRTELGISLRVGQVAGVDPTVISRLRRPLGEIARSHGVSLVPLPSTRGRAGDDQHTLRLLLEGDLADVAGEWGTATVQSLIEQVGKCRVVIAGAYHVAVFALSQGIPVVAVAKSDYYKSKYVGLESLFGVGCEIVSLDDPKLDEHLREAMARVWERADELRPLLLAAAERQVRWAEAAFARAMAIAAPPMDAHPRAG